MKLNKYTWNNGTQSSPIILTNDQIKKLIAIGQRKDIESKVSGYITTPSRKIQKLLKHMIESQFKDLNIIYDEELADVFNISLGTNTIKEGTRELISINTTSGITHSLLKWKYDFSNFVIDGDISEQNIKDRIRVENGYLVVDDPKENASWSVQLTLTAYPSYYSEEEFNSIPASDKSNIILNVIAKKIEDISISTNENVSINSQVKLSVSPIPIDSTKLKGVNYTYSTTTPDILAINTSTQGTTISAKKEGTANLTVTLHAYNNTVIKSNTITFEVYDLFPLVFIIDQRYVSGTSDPDAMVSENYILNPNGSLTSIASSGSVGDPSNNTLTWLRQNTHAYVSKNTGITGVRLKQLSDSNRKVFTDGSSAMAYISNKNGEFDVFLKFGSDIYYKTQAWTPEGQSEPDPDYVAVTIAKKIPKNENSNEWSKWSQYTLIGVYPACEIKNKLHSLSGQQPSITLSQQGAVNKAKARGVNFSICNYDMAKLFAFLFYGYYSSLGSQQKCGYGTKIDYNFEDYYPKITGGTDELGMTDTNATTGTGASNPSKDQLMAGFGPDIKAVNFWGLESYWGDVSIFLSNLHFMAGFRTDGSVDADPANYVVDYLDKYKSIVVTNPTGKDITYNSTNEFLKDHPYGKDGFLAVSNKNGTITRIINIKPESDDKTGYIRKMIFGSHSDIISKDFGKNASGDTGFTDYSRLDGSANEASILGTVAGDSGDGIVAITCGIGVNSYTTNIGARLLYYGDKSTVHVTDPTEKL